MSSLVSPFRHESLERRSIVVRGLVQGVGFRPFVYRLAESLGIAGSVQNDAGGVRIEAEAGQEPLERFLAQLAADAPTLARIESVSVLPLSPRGELGFTILASDGGGARAFIAPDAATCDTCVSELFDPQNRRYRYPFINCTDCGPRLTIVEGAPYDRERTTMRAFALCAECRREFADPGSRRFHAQPNACPACGPRLHYEGAGATASGEDALSLAVAALRAGAVVAVKGIGGYHLACLASDDEAVARLRRGKQRDMKPFALMALDVPGAERVVHVSSAARGLLAGSPRPIVLCPRRADAPVADAVAPGSPWLGVMLAYAPLHHLLLRELAEPLVMTSGNVSHEPIGFEDAETRLRLAPLADAWLTHDRPIHTRCDDSVVRPVAGGSLVLRRARGMAPEPLTLARPLARPILALGAESNVTFALGREKHVFVSHHLGDLGHYAAYQAFLQATERYAQLFDVTPAVLAHDLHPDYRTTELALRLARERGLEAFAVQHHHAHVASVMLEHGLEGPVLGVAFDGTGLGPDGSLWGGEFLLADRVRSERVAHLHAVPLPGGDRAVKEPWRMALAYLREADEPRDPLSSLGKARLDAVEGLLEKSAFSPRTSSAGRLFDAVAALVGIRWESSYDGQPAIELEWAATSAPPDDVEYDFELTRPSPAGAWVVDTRPLVRGVTRDLRRGTEVGTIARRFHRTLAAAVVGTCERLRAEHGLSRIVLGGGVFANGLLLELVLEGLSARGFCAYTPERFPAGDGGLCLGQLAVAAAQAELRGEKGFTATQLQ